MHSWSLAHLSDQVLLQELAVHASRERSALAALLAHLAEVDERRLYLSAACASMVAYCVRDLHFTSHAAFRRIRAARTARRFPPLFEAIEDGRLHLSAILALAPHLDDANHVMLIESAANRSTEEIEAMLIQRSASATIWDPPPQLPDVQPAHDVQRDETKLAISRVVETIAEQRPTTTIEPLALAAPEVAAAPALEPIERFAFRTTLTRSTQAKLEYAKQLLSHVLRHSDESHLLDRALDALIESLERKKLGKTDRPRDHHERSATNRRQISSRVRRAVWKRDGGQCTFKSASGQRCDERRLLEFDHEVPFARGGDASIENIQLRCRAHNQFDAERVFGRSFMERKRSNR